MKVLSAVRAAVLCCATAALVPGVAVAGPSNGTPQTLRCNMLVTQDLTLTANVFCATGNGFRLAPGVTLDLNGFRIRGTPAGTGVIFSDAGTSTVTNGSLQGWGAAVSTHAWNDPPAEPPTLTDVRVAGGRIEVGAGDLLVRDSLLTGATIDVDYGDVTLERVTLTDGALDTSMGWATVTDSTFVRSTVDHRDAGLTAISASEFDGQGVVGTGIHCYDAVLEITGSTVRHYDTGISAEGCLRLAELNTVSDNGVGLWFGPSAWSQDDEPYTDVRQNIFENNGVGADLRFAVRFSDNTMTENGTAVAATGDWIRVIEGNTVDDSIGTGIVAGGPREIVRDNRVGGGGGQGIVAIGSVDGGGNHASGNAIDPQCEGVFCYPL